MSFSTPTTIGTRIDAVFASLESLPHTNPEIIYATLIGASLIFSFLVLNSGGSSMATMLPPEGDADSLIKPTKIKANKKPVSPTSDEPQPKWHILRLTNYVVTFGFLFSVLQFASNASTYLEDSSTLLQYLVIWSVFMCYFFGFFGISFIELDDLGSEPRNQQHQVVHRQKMPNNERLVLSYILLCPPPMHCILNSYILLLMCFFCVPIHLSTFTSSAWNPQ